MPFILPLLSSRPSQTAFIRHVCSWIRALGIANEVRTDENAFSVTIEPGGRSLFLTNLHADYCTASWWSRNHVVRSYLLLLSQPSDMPSSRDEVLACLRPAIRDLFYLDAVQAQFAQAGKPAVSIPFRPLADTYLIQPMLDMPTSMASVDDAKLGELGLTADQAIEHAIANLKLGDSPFTPIAPGLWASQQRDCYDAARLLLVDRIRRLPDHGHAVVVPVHRDELLIADSGMPEALNRLAELAEAHAGEGRAIGLIPLALQRDGWVEYHPPAGEAHHAITRLRLIGWGGLYADQKQALEEQHAATGEDVFVATYSVASDTATGRSWSYSVWVQACDGLLPKTEQIVLLADGAGGEPIAYRWDDIMQRCGSLLQRTSHRLPRWKTSGFPDQTMLAGIEPVS